jgi:hypothetical protein
MKSTFTPAIPHFSNNGNASSIWRSIDVQCAQSQSLTLALGVAQHLNELPHLNPTRMRFDVHRTRREIGAAALVVPLLAVWASKVKGHVSIGNGRLLEVHTDGVAALVRVSLDSCFNACAVRVIPGDSLLPVNLGAILRRID